MKLQLTHHLYQGTVDTKLCLFDKITVLVNDKPVLVGDSPKVFHSTVEVYKWLLEKQGVEINEVNTRG